MSRAALLGEYFREQARWRGEKADEYDDDRNTQSGMAFVDAAQYVEQLPEDDPRLVRIDKALRLTELGIVIAGHELRNKVRLWRFHGFTGSPSDLLDDIAAAAEHDVANEELRAYGCPDEG
jgi:hypothetical protein